MEILAYLATCQCRKDNRLLVLTNILLQYDYKILHSWPFLFWTNVQIWCCFLVSLLIPIPCVLSELAITSVTTVVATAVAIPETTIPAAWQAKKMRQILPWNIPFSMLLLHLQRFQVPSSLSSVCHAPFWRRSSHSSLNENSGVVMWSDTLTLMRPDRDIISGLCSQFQTLPPRTCYRAPDQNQHGRVSTRKWLIARNVCDEEKVERRRGRVGYVCRVHWHVETLRPYLHVFNGCFSKQRATGQFMHQSDLNVPALYKWKFNNGCRELYSGSCRTHSQQMRHAHPKTPVHTLLVWLLLIMNQIFILFHRANKTEQNNSMTNELRNFSSGYKVISNCFRKISFHWRNERINYPCGILPISGHHTVKPGFEMRSLKFLDPVLQLRRLNFCFALV